MFAVSLRIMPISVLFSFLLSGLISCSHPESPSSFYERYNRNLIAGMNSFKEEASYYSAKKQLAVIEEIPAIAARLNKKPEEAIRFYLHLSRAIAMCKKLELVSEDIQGNAAYLVYKQTDICGNAGTVLEMQKVRLVNEKGWKIDDVEISL